MITKLSDPPRLENRQIITFIRDTYGFDVEVKPLVSDIGQNFYVTDHTGKEYIFKIANKNESTPMLEAQNAVLEHLNNHCPQIRIPKICSNLNNEYISELIGQDNIKHRTRLLSYLSGLFLVDLPDLTESHLKDLGNLLSTLDKSLFYFDHPAIHRYWHWDLKNIPDIKHLTHYIKDPKNKRLVDYFFLQFESQVLSISFKLRKSVIHNDANDHNILVNLTKSPPEVDGIIDFGDMVYSHTVFELAIALAYIMLDKKDPLDSACFVLRSYHETFPLEKIELDVLFYSICARLSQSVTIAAYQKSLRPEDDYLTVTEKPAWRLLDCLLQTNPEKARRVFYDACSMDIDERDFISLKSLIKDRKMYLARPLKVSYKKPLKITRGGFQYLYDQSGETYLDCVNNVCHVGHAHPAVVRAAQQQIAVLNTNTRYLHDHIVLYAKQLTDTMPDPLQVCFFVNSGSEANELALRLAYTHTHQKDVIVIDHGYHGNTPALIDISPYKFAGKGGRGPGPYTHTAMMPDIYRGPYSTNDLQAGKKYAAYAEQIIKNLQQNDKGPAAFIGESLLGCGGQIVLPAGYLKHVYQSVRASGGVCIADEVQVGFGRVGSYFWGFELQGVIPDIVTLGKPIGNGHPLAAVVCTPEVAESFNTGMEFFNTFGGNPVSCAIGLAVLDVIKNENLQENALQVGTRMMHGFEELKRRHPIIGDVRGAGLFIGIELVRDRETLEPATEEASTIIEAMKERGILLSTDGPYDNVIKIKPPMVFNEDNADRVVNALDDVLESL